MKWEKAPKILQEFNSLLLFTNYILDGTLLYEGCNTIYTKIEDTYSINIDPKISPKSTFISCGYNQSPKNMRYKSSRNYLLDMIGDTYQNIHDSSPLTILSQ